MAPRKRTSRRGTGKLGQLKALVHTRAVGRVFSPGPDIPMITERPWNQICVSVGKIGDANVQFKDIAPVLWTQAGFYGVSMPKLDLVVRKARVWTLSNSRPIRVRFSTDGTTPGYAQAYDWPSKLNFANVGYVFPSNVMNICNNSSDIVDVITVEVGNNVGWIAYIDMLWRGSTEEPITQSVRYRLTCPPDPSELSSSEPSPSTSSFAFM